MLHIIAIMLLGVAIGYLFKNKEITQKTEISISVTIISLLFILGLSIGSNESIVKNLSVYGSQAVVLAIFGLVGSVLASWIIYRFLYRKGGAE